MHEWFVIRQATDTDQTFVPACSCGWRGPDHKVSYHLSQRTGDRLVMVPDRKQYDGLSAEDNAAKAALEHAQNERRNNDHQEG